MAESEVMKQYQAQLNAANDARLALEKTKKLAFAALAEATKAQKAEIDGHCVNVLGKQKQIDELVKKISQNQVSLQKQAQQWSELIQKFSTALKTLGDAGQTASVIINDLQQVQSKFEDKVKQSQ